MSFGGERRILWEKLTVSQKVFGAAKDKGKGRKQKQLGKMWNPSAITKFYSNYDLSV